MDKLSALIASLNEKFGTEPRRRRQGVVRAAEGQRSSPTKRCASIALNNDSDQYKIALEHKAKDMIVDRHEANGVLFDAFFENPEFQVRLLDYLATTYEEFRAEA